MVNESLPEPRMTHEEATFATLEEMRQEFEKWQAAIEVLEGDSDEI